MPRAGDGSYSQPGSTDAVPNATASSTAFNTLIDDFGDEIENSLSRDGQGGMRQNLPMGTKKISNMGAGTVASDAARIDQVQKLYQGWTNTTGTADAIIGTYSPNITTLTEGMKLRFRAHFANATTTPTFAAGTTTAAIIVKGTNDALVAGDIPGGDDAECEVVWNADLLRWVLINPYYANVVAASTTVAGIVEMATNAETLAGASTTLAVSPVNLASLWQEWNKGAYAVGIVHSQAHSLGAYPKAFEVWLECTSNDRGYGVGDRVKATSLSNNGSADCIPTIFMNTTTCLFAMPNNLPYLGNAAGSTEAAITAAKWDVIFRIQK